MISLTPTIQKLHLEALQATAEARKAVEKEAAESITAHFEKVRIMSDRLINAIEIGDLYRIDQACADHDLRNSPFLRVIEELERNVTEKLLESEPVPTEVDGPIPKQPDPVVEEPMFQPTKVTSDAVDYISSDIVAAEVITFDLPVEPPAPTPLPPHRKSKKR